MQTPVAGEKLPRIMYNAQWIHKCAPKIKWRIIAERVRSTTVRECVPDGVSHRASRVPRANAVGYALADARASDPVS